MVTLYARCPTTLALVDTGIKTDLDTLAKLTQHKIAILCERCDEVHVVAIDELFSSLKEGGILKR
jgi:hypothetical protein